MPTYLSPGVYVEEIPSGSAPIAGVGTSIAAFIGTINLSSSSREETITVDQTNEGDAKNKFELPIPENIKQGEKLEFVNDSASFAVNGNSQSSFEVTIENDKPFVSFNTEVAGNASITGSFKVTITSATSTSSTNYNINQVEGEKVGTGDGTNTIFDLSNYPVVTSGFTVKVGQAEKNNGVSLKNDDSAKQSRIEFTTAPESGKEITIDYYLGKSVSEEEIKLCTNFTEFKNFFGDFSTDAPKGQNTLAHAVYGFFRNGGTRCYVTWITGKQQVDNVLDKFEAIDEITIVATPGNLDLRDNIKDHCEKMSDRIAVLDSQETIDLSSTTVVDTLKPFNSNYAALYFPWIQVYDPASDSSIYIPPSGHIAGVYARVDGQRGVHKAPANETILGALDLKYNLSKAKQDGLNPDGINCIRKLNGNIRVWGARTLGGDANTEFKYVNIRRHFSYLRDSIDKGTQWTVFEPNDSELWAKIRRNIGAFLLMEWRKGALFGTTPQDAFYVKCDAETNPPEVRDLGQVVTEIGLAVVKPAEFVIFRLSQWAGPGA
ncbi:MAG: phage tail sheath subtilisin-like domain-containing protein [Spirulina sp.]